jgi:hypothetical protein
MDVRSDDKDMNEREGEVRRHPIIIDPNVGRRNEEPRRRWWWGSIFQTFKWYFDLHCRSQFKFYYIIIHTVQAWLIENYLYVRTV